MRLKFFVSKLLSDAQSGNHFKVNKQKEKKRKKRNKRLKTQTCLTLQLLNLVSKNFLCLLNFFPARTSILDINK